MPVLIHTGIGSHWALLTRQLGWAFGWHQWAWNQEEIEHICENYCPWICEFTLTCIPNTSLTIFSIVSQITLGTQWKKTSHKGKRQKTNAADFLWQQWGGCNRQWGCSQSWADCPWEVGVPSFMLYEICNSKFCKIDQNGNHVHLTFQQLSNWAAGLVNTRCIIVPTHLTQHTGCRTKWCYPWLTTENRSLLNVFWTTCTPELQHFKYHFF